MSFIGSIIIGILAGYIASRIEKGKGSGCVINLVLGIIGGLLGGWLFGVVGIKMPFPVWACELITSIVGAVLLIWIAAWVRGK